LPEREDRKEIGFNVERQQKAIHYAETSTAARLERVMKAFAKPAA